ncbi:hypothetical protein C8J40_104261 [Sphingomonas sp. PP-CC-3A-396]|nr:hypothetical protein C8J40_104261 [Sphingomonas sp. PP-CC-3A-396]
MERCASLSPSPNWAPAFAGWYEFIRLADFSVHPQAFSRNHLVITYLTPARTFIP